MASNTIEANRKLFNYYFLLPVLDSTYQYSTDDSAGIYSIAAQCPSEAGTVVWQARALYDYVVNDIVNFEDNCDAIGKSMIHTPTKTNTTITDNFKLYPNPNDGNMIIEYHLQDNENGIVSIYDLAGRVVKIISINSKNTTLQINESELNAGTYYYSIRVNNNPVKTEKLIIIK